MRTLVFLFSALVTAALAGALLLHGCMVDQVCYSQADCPKDQSCHSSTGTCSARLACTKSSDCPKGMNCSSNLRCIAGQCATDNDCPGDQTCQDGLCKSSEELKCPNGMVPVENSFCIDIYEASRPDATTHDPGTDESLATSRPDVIPWQVPTGSNDLAQAACKAAGKRLCTALEWTRACKGPDDTQYSYGDQYEPGTCNGIDTFCSCDSGPCASHDPCPYAGCFHDCRSNTNFHLETTGAFSKCTNAYGVYDMNGNVWEHVLDGDDTQIRGGAYNCSNSEEFHRCEYIPGTWTPSAKGFRCCYRPGED